MIQTDYLSWVGAGAAVSGQYADAREEARDQARLRNMYFQQVRLHDNSDGGPPPMQGWVGGGFRTIVHSKWVVKVGCMAPMWVTSACCPECVRCIVCVCMCTCQVVYRVIKYCTQLERHP